MERNLCSDLVPLPDLEIGDGFFCLRPYRELARYQRQLSTAIKRARFLALLPYCDRH